MDLLLKEAQLFRILMDVFGKDQVLPKAKLSFVCGEQLAALIEAAVDKESKECVRKGSDFANWAKNFRCLFTVINHEDEPCMVVDFFAGFEDSVDPEEAMREQYLPHVLKRAKIHYMRISDAELNLLLHPDRQLSFLQLVEGKIGDEVLV